VVEPPKQAMDLPKLAMETETALSKLAMQLAMQPAGRSASAAKLPQVAKHASQPQEFDNPVPELQALADAKHARQQIDDDDQGWGTWGDCRGKYDKTHSGGYQKNANWAPYPGTSQCKSVSWQKGPMEVGSSVEQAATKADWEFV